MSRQEPLEWEASGRASEGHQIRVLHSRRCGMRCEKYSLATRGSPTRSSSGRWREDSRAGSDVDIAIEVEPGESLTTHAIGALISRLEAAAGRPVDLVLLDEAPSPLAYRVFRDGQLLFERLLCSTSLSPCRSVWRWRRIGSPRPAGPFPTREAVGSGLRAGGEGRLASDRSTLPESQNLRPRRPATSEEYDLVQEQDQDPGLLSGERVRRRPIPPDWATCLLRGEPDPDGSLVVDQ